MKYVFACGLIMGLASPALAQTESAAPVGPRIEARVGWDRTVLSEYASDTTVTYKDSAGKSGVTYGGEIGYDLPFGQFATIGAYAGIEEISTKSCLTAQDMATANVARACVKAGRNIMAGARIGYMFGSSGLFYGKVGYSNGRTELVYTDTALPAANVEEGFNRDGFHLGGGVEVGRARGVYGKVEYLYTNYNGFEYRDGNDVAKLDADRHQVVAGLGYRF